MFKLQDDNQACKDYDYPKHPLQATHHGRGFICWIRSIRGRRYRIPLFDEYSISDHSHLNLLTSFLSTVANAITLSHLTQPESISRFVFPNNDGDRFHDCIMHGHHHTIPHFRTPQFRTPQFC